MALCRFLPAAEDLYPLYKDPKHHLKLDFGLIVHRYAPEKTEWKPNRLAGVVFRSWLFGMAENYPKIRLEFFKEKTKFTFNK
tara:strand:+ start:869 stop:1114 length:246 start_codon:yes stop_codon:yes gene_type:complete